MQVIQALKMENEVAQRASIHELEGTLVFLLRLLRTEFRHDPIHLWQVKEDREFPVSACWLNLERFQSRHWALPLHTLELGFRASLVEICLNIDHELVCENKESTLVHKVGVSFDDERMGLIAVFYQQITVVFEEVLPVCGQLALD